MLGRVRASSSSLECLELERSPSKIIKDDSLSIYETTLMKLKQGSRRDLSSQPEINCKEATTTDADDCSSDCQSSKEEGNRNMSILYLFSTYNKSSRHALSSPHEEAMTVETSVLQLKHVSSSSVS